MKCRIGIMTSANVPIMDHNVTTKAMCEHFSILTNTFGISCPEGTSNSFVFLISSSRKHMSLLWWMCHFK